MSARGGRIIKIQTRCILTLILVGLTAPLQAQDRIDLTTHDYSRYRLEAVKVGAGPQIDGRLDDKVWSQAPVATGFTQFSPDYLAPATERTEVRVLYDDLNLYIGATVYDSDPKRVIGRETRRDARTWNTDDTFDVSVSPFPDMSNVYFFSTTPLGQQRDSFVGNFGENTNSSWDGIWWVKATRHDKGWSAEIAIPWKVLEECAPKSIPENGDQWRVNYSRVHWDLDVINGEYQKLDKPEYNWVWTPQGLIAMHYPEIWGFVQFSTEKVSSQKSDFVWDTIEDHKWYMRTMYYNQKKHFNQTGQWMSRILHLKNLTPYNRNFKKLPQIHLTHSGYEIIGEMKDGRIIIIEQDGRITVE